MQVGRMKGSTVLNVWNVTAGCIRQALSAHESQYAVLVQQFQRWQLNLDKFANEYMLLPIARRPMASAAFPTGCEPQE